MPEKCVLCWNAAGQNLIGKGRRALRWTHCKRWAAFLQLSYCEAVPIGWKGGPGRKIMTFAVRGWGLIGADSGSN